MQLVVVALAFVASVLAQGTPGFMINTPANAVTCQPLLITWSGGTPPYFLSVLPGADPNGQALVDFGQQDGTSFTWTAVNQQANTQLGLTLRDSNGNTAQSAPFTVNGGSNTTCLSQPASGVPATGGAPPATSVANPTATSPAATSPVIPGASSVGSPSAGTSRPASSAASRAPSAASASASSTTNAASAKLAQVGVAGFLGAALAALLA